MRKINAIERLVRETEKNGILVTMDDREVPTLTAKDLVFPHIFVLYCYEGSASALYDMRKMELCKNQLAVIMPGHVVRHLNFSEDFRCARVSISSEMFNELRLQILSHDYDKFRHNPTCMLTDLQAKRMLAIFDQLQAISQHSELELAHRKRLLMAQLTVGYEFLNFYRREQDEQWTLNRYAGLFNNFCELVIKHYKESREVQFYAYRLHLTPKHLSKVFRTYANGISPAKWIEQYVIAQAQRLIETQPDATLQEIAYMLGFSEPSSFYRYFKHATGMTAKQYRDNVQG